MKGMNRMSRKVWKVKMIGVLVVALSLLMAAGVAGEERTDASMDLWKTIDALTQQIPFSQQKVETALSTQLAEKPLGSGNNLYHLFESQPIALADGVVISNVDLRIKRSGDHPGFLVLVMDETDGAGVTLEQVQAQYSQLAITDIPRGDSLEEEFSYSQIFPWRKLSFGFKARDPERLASIVFDPNAAE